MLVVTSSYFTLYGGRISFDWRLLMEPGGLVMLVGGAVLTSLAAVGRYQFRGWPTLKGGVIANALANCGAGFVSALVLCAPSRFLGAAPQQQQQQQQQINSTVDG